MSRIGKQPIKLPAGVKVNFTAPNVEVSGKLGKLTRFVPSSISIVVQGDSLEVKNLSDSPDKRSLHGLTRTLLRNMVTGVSDGYSKTLELQGVGFRAQAAGKMLNMQLGFSHPVEFPLPDGITATVDANTKITLKGADKELLGLTAAKLREVRPPEPYKGKGIRYSGEVVQLKQGKAAGAGGK